MQSGQVHATVYDRNAAGLAQAFMEGGIGIYVGTMWAIPDEEPVVALAQSFYSSLLSGRTAGQATWDARRSIIETFGEAELTWASYLLFGNPTARLGQASNPASIQAKSQGCADGPGVARGQGPGGRTQ
jgi:CHAT domain-containing protein